MSVENEKSIVDFDSYERNWRWWYSMFRCKTKHIERNLSYFIFTIFCWKMSPGKRHWLKMKRDYLGEENCMVPHGSLCREFLWFLFEADSCDCIVLGAFYGTGKHGSLLATFLCGVLDKDARKFRTVCKGKEKFSATRILFSICEYTTVLMTKPLMHFPKYNWI